MKSKKHLEFCHAGFLSFEDFCRLYDLTYVGTLVYGDTDEIALDIGVVVIINGYYYSTQLSFITNNNATATTLKCNLIPNFNRDSFLSLDDCSIMIDIWDTSIAADGPIWSLAFEKSSLKRAQQRISTKADVDILVDENPIEKYQFMQLTLMAKSA